MTTEFPIAHPRFRCMSQVSDYQLKVELQQLNQKCHRLEAELLLYLGELDQRRLYREEACSSAFEFCTSRMGYSEDVAYKRVGAARLMRQFPGIYDLLAEGQLHLTALMLLKPHLTEANHQDWLLAACHKSKRELERLLVSRCPKPDAKASVRKLPSASLVPNEPNLQSSSGDCKDAASGFEEPTFAPAAATAAAAIAGTGSVGGTVSTMAAEPAGAFGLKTKPTVAAPQAHPDPRVAPLSSSTYRVTFTASEQLKQKLDRARELLSHCIPPSDLPALIERALDQLLEREQTRRYGAIPKCKPASPRRDGPAAQPEAVEHSVNHDRAPAKTETVSPHAEVCPEPNGVVGEQVRPDPTVCPGPKGVVGVQVRRDPEVCPGPNGVVGEQVRRDSTEANEKPSPIATQLGNHPLDPDPARVVKTNSTGIATQQGESPLDPDPTRTRVARTISTGGAVARTEVAGAASRRRRQPRACVRRAVFERDAGQCTFVDPQGRRCDERHFLQFDHIEAYAIGGAETVSNLRLRCRSHNALEAEKLFGQKRVKAAIAHARQQRTR
jgi:hypothetical protein